MDKTQENSLEWRQGRGAGSGESASQKMAVVKDDEPMAVEEEPTPRTRKPRTTTKKKS